MFTVLAKEKISSEIFRMEVYAPKIAERRKAGQFIILQQGGEYHERIPLTSSMEHKCY